MVKLHGAVLPALSSFPDSPTQGRLVFVNDVLYVFTDVDGLDSWYPITNRTRRYVHNQLTGSTAWVVTHDLGTVELLVICYDDSGDLITPTGIAYNTADQITISFGSLTTGDCAIFIDVAEKLSNDTGNADTLDNLNSTQFLRRDVDDNFEAATFSLSNSGNRIELQASKGHIELARINGDAHIDFKNSVSEDHDVRLSQDGSGQMLKVDGISGGGGIKVEGSLVYHAGNLDTTVFSLKNGTRAFTGVVGGVTPTVSNHLATKSYVDGLVTGLDWQNSVLDKDLNDPPTGQSTGDRYLISTSPPTATGAWAGHDNDFCEWNGSSWDFAPVSEGMACWVEDEDIVYVYNGTVWVKFGATTTHNNQLGLNDGDYKHLTATELSKLSGIEDGAEANDSVSDILQSNTYEETLTSAKTTITLDFDHDDFGAAYVDGVRQMSGAFSYSGTDQIVFDETLPIGSKVVFTHLVAQIANSPFNVGTIELKDDSGTLKIDDKPLGSFTRKNLIINGDFHVWQRNGSFPAIATGIYSTDRFCNQKVSSAVYTISRSTTVPTLAQSNHRSYYSLKLDVTTADNAINTTDYVLLYQGIEGYNLPHFAGKTCTLSFWVRSGVTGVHCVSFQNNAADRSYVADYTVNSANTWEKKSITLDIDVATGTWDYNNNVGLWITWTLMAGVTFRTTAGSWQTGNYLASGSPVNVVSSTANNFHLAQIQFEVGEVPTEFEYRDFAEELALCQRYFVKSYNYGVYSGASTSNGVIETIAYSTGYSPGACRFPVEMRAAPTMKIWSRSGVADNCSINGDNSVAGSVGYIGTKGIGFLRSTSSEFNVNSWAEYHFYADIDF